MVGDILQPTHLLFILVVALLVLGPKRLPEVGRTLGSGLRDFRQAINGGSSDSAYDWQHQMAEATEPAPQPQRSQPPMEAEPVAGAPGATAAVATPAQIVSPTAVPAVDRPVVRPAPQAAAVTPAQTAPAAGTRATSVGRTRAESRPARAPRPAAPAPTATTRRAAPPAGSAPTRAAQPSPVDRSVQRIPRPGESVSRPRRPATPRTSPTPRDS